MHKIKKGIKKKIKGKKEKEDSEIFTEEEFEKYKKQKAEKNQAPAEEPAPADQDNLPEEDFPKEQEQITVSIEEPIPAVTESADDNSEQHDWKNFFSATDTVLKKTSVNLEHIKESSYFQVKKPEKLADFEATVPTAPQSKSSSKSWVNLEQGGLDDEEEQESVAVVEEIQVPEEELEKKKPLELKDIVLKPLDELPTAAEEDYADIFDTTFVDNVEGGEVQLFEIPDSPTDENFNDPDPFDTSDVDKVLHLEKEEEKKQTGKTKRKNLVNLGCAVDVLTGKVPSKVIAPQQKEPEEKEINLFDESEVNTEKEEKEPTEESKLPEQEEKSALDEILFSEEPNSDLPDTIELCPISTYDREDINKNDDDLKGNNQNLSEDIYGLLDPLALPDEKKDLSKQSHIKDLVDEFDSVDGDIQLKQEIRSDAIDDNIKDEFDAEFAVLAAESIAKDKEKEIDKLGIDDNDDPFDTSVINELLHEGEEKGEVNPEFSDKRPPRPKPPVTDGTVNDKAEEEDDPFDTSGICDQPIEADPFDIVQTNPSLPDTLTPLQGYQTESDNFDPFDTSAVTEIELKVLEGELLSGTEKDDLDFDFNPRQGEVPKTPPSPAKSPVCLLTATEEETDIPVLAPVSASNFDEPDPFDTSIAEKVEIKTLEEELLSRDNEPIEIELTEEDNEKPSALLSLLNSEAPDPFDTTIANQFIPTPEVENEEETQPEESELVEEEVECNEPDLISCLLATTPTDENPTLEPKQVDNFGKNSEVDDLDPFDTSIAEQFGKVELKALELELLKEEPIKPITDNDFDPRSVGSETQKPSELIIEKRVTPPCLLTGNSPITTEQQLLPLSPTNTNASHFESEKDFVSIFDIDTSANSHPVSQQEPQEDIDPFDTSVADTFGSIDLTTIESQISTNSKTKPELTDNEFNPREELRKIPERPPCPNILNSNILDSSSEIPGQSLEILPTKVTISSEQEEFDPFDTSIAQGLAPTKAEIELLDKQFL